MLSYIWALSKVNATRPKFGKKGSSLLYENTFWKIVFKNLPIGNGRPDVTMIYRQLFIPGPNMWALASTPRF